MSDSNWHLSKTVTIGNIVAVAAALMALVGSYYTLDKRLALLEQSDSDQDKHMVEIKSEIMGELDEIKGLIMQVHFDKGE